MDDAPANDRLAALTAVIGEEGSRELVSLYLDAFPPLMRDLSSGDIPRAHRAAHSLKSSSQQMGVPVLARRMAELEERLEKPGQTVTPADLEAVAREFAQAEGPLRAFLGG